jgi:hypothetical protein
MHVMYQKRSSNRRSTIIDCQVKARVLGWRHGLKILARKLSAKYLSCNSVKESWECSLICNA